MVPDVLPCYVVCDLSPSLVDHVDEVNAGFREFRGAVHADPSVAALTRVCVVGFAAEPTVLQPLRPAAELADLSGSGLRGATNFGPAFTFLRETIDRDLRALEARLLRVHRPVVFFASDGRPADAVTWPEAFAGLTDPAWPARPAAVVAFGLGAVDRATLDRIGTSRVFLGQDGVRLGTALAASVTSAARRPDRAGAIHDVSTSAPPAGRTLRG